VAACCLLLLLLQRLHDVVDFLFGHRADFTGAHSWRGRDDVLARRQAKQPEHAAVVGHVRTGAGCRDGHVRALTELRADLQQADGYAERRLAVFVGDASAHHAAALQSQRDSRSCGRRLSV
jgi:hypothetical protein